MSTGYGREGIKAGMCDASVPCTWAPLRWLVSLQRRAITSVRPLPLPLSIDR